MNEDSNIIKMSEPVSEPEFEIKPGPVSDPEPELESIVDLEVIPRPWDSPATVNEDSNIIKMSEPVSEPEFEIKPGPVSDPEPELESIVDLEVIPRPWDSPATVNEDSNIIKMSEPASNTIPEPDLEVNLEPVSDPKPELESMPGPTPISEPVSDPGPEIKSEPELDSTTVPNPVSEPISEFKPEPISYPEPELESTTVPTPVSEPLFVEKTIATLGLEDKVSDDVIANANKK